MRVERRHGEDNFYSTLVPCYDNVCFVWLIYCVHSCSLVTHALLGVCNAMYMFVVCRWS